MCFVSSPVHILFFFFFQCTLACVRPSASFTECSPASSSGEAPPPPLAPPCPLTWRAAGCWGTTQTSHGNTPPTLAQSSQQVCEQVSSSLPPRLHLTPPQPYRHASPPTPTASHSKCSDFPSDITPNSLPFILLYENISQSQNRVH